MADEKKEVECNDSGLGTAFLFLCVLVLSAFIFYYINKTDGEIKHLKEKWIVPTELGWQQDENVIIIQNQINELKTLITASSVEHPSYGQVNALNKKILDLGNAVGYHYSAPSSKDAHWEKGNGLNYQDDFGTNTSF